MELQGHQTGRDVMTALDAATAGHTYQAGILRAFAIDRLKDLEKRHRLHSVAFESLGPPRLTKALYEAFEPPFPLRGITLLSAAQASAPRIGSAE